MTPKPESETDPPQVPNIIAALDAGTATPELIAEWANHPYVCTTDIIRRAIAALLAARAAEAAQHRQFKAAIATALCVENEHGPVSEESIVEAAEVTLGQLFDLSARLAAVEAERDKQAEQIAMLLTICPNCAGLMAPEPPDSGCSGVYCPECRSDSAELRAERDRLKAALQDVTIGMDRAGGDRDGMPECPWCQSQGRPEDAEEGYAHDVDCSLMMARAALTTQHQPSTDGETR